MKHCALTQVEVVFSFEQDKINSVNFEVDVIMSIVANTINIHELKNEYRHTLELFIFILYSTSPSQMK